MKCSLGISNSLEETSGLPHSIVFFYFFALITEEGFLIPPCYSLELCIQMDIYLLFSFAFAYLLFSAVCKASSDNHFAFFHFIFLGIFCLFVWFGFNLFIFYWRIIALQNFVVFCQTSTRISHRYTHVPSFLNLPLHPTPLGWYRAPVWVSWAIQQIPLGYLFCMW